MTSELQSVKDALLETPRQWEQWKPEPLVEKLSLLKKQAIIEHDEKSAKDVWCIQEIVRLYTYYIEAFRLLKIRQFYEGWCTLEQAELACLRLERHFKDKYDVFKTRFCFRKIEQWQGIFPYKLYMSPEILHIEKICSICNQLINPRDPCGHRVGEIYQGEYCVRVITKSKFLGLAFVTKPVQKYSVPFVIGTPDDNGRPKLDTYNYSIVDYAIERIESPFHEWSYEWTTRLHPHRKFLHIPKESKCPCDNSDRK